MTHVHIRAIGVLSSMGLLAAAPGVAVAQSTGGASTSGAPPVTTSPPPAVSSDSPSVGVSDVVVTAQRRSERSQSVPITISAIDASTAAAIGITDTTDLTMAVPGLQMAPQNEAVTPFIRGLGNRNSAVGDESGSAVYVDGVYVADITAARFEMNNIDHIEVLKGPQGTLFGRNAAAGVIQIITRDPSQTPSADLEVGYANYDTSSLNFYGTAGVLPDLAADIAVSASRQDQGWGRNAYTGGAAYLGNSISARSKWIWTVDPKTTVKFSFDYDNSVPVVPPAYTPLPGQHLITGVSYLGFYTPEETDNVHGFTHQWGASADVTHDFGAATLVSISSYRNDVSYQLLDQDGTPTNFVTANFNQKSETETQELQLLSPKDAPFKWIGGLYYYHNAASYDPLELQGVALPAGLIENIFATLTTNSYAAYGQATFNLGDKSHFTAGFRYSEDDHHIEGLTETNLRGDINPANQEADFGSPTWHFALDRQFTTDIFGYVQYSRGFKSGVFNAVAATTPAVKPEIIDTVEAGVKSEFFERRLRFNASAFYNSASDIQLQIPVSGATFLVNAAGAVTRGVDLDVEAIPIQHLLVTATAEYLDGYFSSFPDGPVFTEKPAPGYGYTQTSGSLTGRETPYSPPFTTSLVAKYTIPTSQGKFVVTGSYYYSSRFFFDPQNIARQPSYSLLNGALSWTSPDRRWGIDVWGKNLNNVRYYTNIIPQAFGLTAIPAAPLTFGVRLNVHIG